MLPGRGHSQQLLAQIWVNPTQGCHSAYDLYSPDQKLSRLNVSPPSKVWIVLGRIVQGHIGQGTHRPGISSGDTPVGDELTFAPTCVRQPKETSSIMNIFISTGGPKISSALRLSMIELGKLFNCVTDKDAKKPSLI